MENKITVFIAEDHKLVRDAWKLTIEKNGLFTIIGEAEDGQSTLEFCLNNKVDVIVMDINLKDGKSIPVIEMMLDKIPNANIVVVSMLNIYHIVKDLYKIGIKAFLTKNSSKEELIDAILKASQKKQYFSNEISNLFLERENDAVNLLNSREIKIIHYICKGLSNKEIGVEMKISDKTIEGHKTKIYKKLKVNNNIGIYEFAHKNGLLDSTN